jgi:NADPH-dependent ferric siderophore reductase
MAAHHGEVLTTTRLTPTLVRVVLGGPGLDAFEMPEDTDAYVNVAIPPRGADYGPVFDPREVLATHPAEMAPARRRYTVRRWDAASRELTLDFVVHGDAGAAGPWALRARVGDVLVLNGPGGGYRPDPGAAWHLMVGDESAVPAIAASLEALAPGDRAVVRLVCDGPEHEVALTSAADVDLVWLHRGSSAAGLAEAVAALAFPDGSPQVFVHGEAEEVREVRRHLVLERGLPVGPMSCSPYWRRGMTDEQWRSVKKEFTAAMDADLAG